MLKRSTAKFAGGPSATGSPNLQDVCEHADVGTDEDFNFKAGLMYLSTPTSSASCAKAGAPIRRYSPSGHDSGNGGHPISRYRPLARFAAALKTSANEATASRRIASRHGWMWVAADLLGSRILQVSRPPTACAGSGGSSMSPSAQHPIDKQIAAIALIYDLLTVATPQPRKTSSRDRGRKRSISSASASW